MSARPPLPADLWDSLPPEARALILAQRAEVAELQARVQALQLQVQDLHDRLRQNSTNSPAALHRPARRQAPPAAPALKPPLGRPAWA
jgi:hypothetical protein